MLYMLLSAPVIPSYAVQLSTRVFCRRRYSRTLFPPPSSFSEPSLLASYRSSVYTYTYSLVLALLLLFPQLCLRLCVGSP